jgi:hypothetical protein
MIQRRHVFYVEGYDPQGAAGYYGIFQSAAKRFQKLWPIAVDLHELKLDTDGLAHWDVETSGPNWRTSTRYEFLRLENIIRANMREPLWRQVPRALYWALDDLLSGTTFRIFWASWRFGLHLVGYQILLMAWIAASAAAGALAGVLAAQAAGLPVAIAVVVALAAAAAVFVALRPLTDRWLVIQVNNCWPKLREFARGGSSSLRQPIDIFANRVVAAVRANEADEILIVGHSGGGTLAPAVVTRALELAPDLGRHGPRIVFMTLGSVMPAAALHPDSGWLRAKIQRIAVEPSILWLDCQSRKDCLNFWGFDPVAGLGVTVGRERCNPQIWQVRMRDSLSPQSYWRLRWNLFRIHYQFILANDNRAPYDYLMLCCGPVPVEEWAKCGRELVEAFLEDGSYAQAGGRSNEAIFAH